jgi:predicted dehydrogenase
MDGVMFMHSHRLGAMRAAIDDSRNLGTIQRIQTGFSFCAPASFFEGNIRSSSALEPHGCLGDLGWYCLRFTLWALNWKLPNRVTGRILSQTGRADSPAPVPTEFSGELLYDGGPSAGFYCAFTTELQQWAVVSGTRGYLHLSDFVLPYYGNELHFDLHNARFETEGCEFRMHPGIRTQTLSEPSNSHPEAQESRLFRNFSEQIQSGTLNEDWPMMAHRTQQVLEACLASAYQGGVAVTVTP